MKSIACSPDVIGGDGINGKQRAGSTFTTHGNTFQVSYEGGDGNDLTLTVVS